MAVQLFSHAHSHYSDIYSQTSNHIAGRDDHRANTNKNAGLSKHDAGDGYRPAEHNVRQAQDIGKSVSDFHAFMQRLSAFHTGGHGADVIHADYASHVHGGKGADVIHADYASHVHGGKGADVIHADYASHVSGGHGADVIHADYASYVHGGNGANVIHADYASHVHGGRDADVIHADYASHVHGGKGADVIHADYASHVHGGYGADVIHADYASHVHGGKGADVIHANYASHVHGGKGADTIHADYADFVYGGEGNDIIHASHAGYIDGGSGDDIINLSAAGSEVKFGLGSGNDVINASGDVTIDLWRGAAQNELSLDDFIIKREGNRYEISIKGSDDKLTINLAPGAKLSLAIANGDEVVKLDLTGSNEVVGPLSSPQQDAQIEALKWLNKALEAGHDKTQNDTYSSAGETTDIDTYRVDVSEGQSIPLSDLFDKADLTYEGAGKLPVS